MKLLNYLDIGRKYQKLITILINYLKNYIYIYIRGKVNLVMNLLWTVFNYTLMTTLQIRRLQHILKDLASVQKTLKILYEANFDKML